MHIFGMQRKISRVEKNWSVPQEIHGIYISHQELTWVISRDSLLKHSFPMNSGCLCRLQGGLFPQDFFSCFSDSVTLLLLPELEKRGMPYVASGFFQIVFKLWVQLTFSISSIPWVHLSTLHLCNVHENSLCCGDL